MADLLARYGVKCGQALTEALKHRDTEAQVRVMEAYGYARGEALELLEAVAMPPEGQ